MADTLFGCLRCRDPSSSDPDELFGVVRGDFGADLVLRFGREVFSFDVEVRESRPGTGGSADDTGGRPSTFSDCPPGYWSRRVERAAGLAADDDRNRFVGVGRRGW